MQPPTVVKLQRKRNKIIQDCDIYIGRQLNRGGWKLKKSKWANPFTISAKYSREEALKKYKEYVLSSPELLKSLIELSGKRLGCWCHNGTKNPPCHGDVLIELFNEMINH